MGFVGNYAPYGLSPQTDGMPVIPVKSRLIFIRRLFLHTLIEFFLKLLGALLTAGINNMTITLRDHLCLSMTGITLYCLDVTASQYQFIVAQLSRQKSKIFIMN